MPESPGLYQPHDLAGSLSKGLRQRAALARCRRAARAQLPAALMSFGVISPTFGVAAAPAAALAGGLATSNEVSQLLVMITNTVAEGLDQSP
jgi:hypothetical protein